ncbi:hypothetical protein E1295_28915 [Nonomuraea mesophila]|uniref:Lipopolysaccharide biosynthesis protein n=1 Tax=Nonomuraea mesophila TaxID=2530382 RepID=A0A4R5F2Z0_9ACTN|nr:hypothetical protein [Nonomuraea mesophila]TDE41764.1 hypothetical protein E1295_28915 [Nonomuraea mesophila]
MTWTRARIMSVLARWWLPLSLTLGASGGAVYAVASQAVYSADAYVVVVAGGDPAQAIDFASAYARISAHPGLLTGDENEWGSLSVAASPDAPMVRLTSVAPTGWEAADRANRAATALITYANRHATDTRVRLAPFASASIPTHPSAPLPLGCVAVGGLGAALVAGLVRLAAPQALRQVRREEPAPVLTGAKA